MKHLYKKIAVVGMALALQVAPMMTLAQTNPFDRAQQDVTNIGNNAGVSVTTGDQALPMIVGRLINIVLGFLGILLLAYLLYAGFLWMTSGGDSKNVDKARGMIRDAIIGLIIIVSAFAISQFVLSKLVTIAQ